MIRILVTYDIADDKTRKRIGDVCLDYGLDREQYSVFVGQLKPTHMRAMYKKFMSLLKSEGNIVIVPIAKDDWERRLMVTK